MNQLSQPHPLGLARGNAAVLATVALTSFALNSLLCRAALGARLIDAFSFTTLRIVSGAVVLMLLAAPTARASSGAATLPGPGSLASAVALFVYALPFSLAYLRIPAGTGAFVAFGCVQITMIGSDILAGRGLRAREAFGMLLALLGLGWLTRPGAESPDAFGVFLMALAGCAWGIYSVRGRTSGPPLQATARNFAAAVPLSLIASFLTLSDAHATWKGVALAFVSGAVTSGLGYVAWYAALPALSATRAAILQLVVPPLASLMGVVILAETLSPRLLTAAPLILGGIAIAVTAPKRRSS